MKLENIKKQTKLQLRNSVLKSEESIQKEIVNYCKLNNILIFSVPNEATRNNSKFIGMGVLPGASDLVLVLDKIIFVELKNEIGKQSQQQIEFQNKVEEKGHEYKLIRSLTEFKNLIK